MCKQAHGSTETRISPLLKTLFTFVFVEVSNLGATLEIFPRGVLNWMVVQANWPKCSNV